MNLDHPRITVYCLALPRIAASWRPAPHPCPAPHPAAYSRDGTTTWPCARVVQGLACKASYVGSNPATASAFLNRQTKGGIPEGMPPFRSSVAVGCDRLPRPDHGPANEELLTATRSVSLSVSALSHSGPPPDAGRPGSWCSSRSLPWDGLRPCPPAHTHHLPPHISRPPPALRLAPRGGPAAGQRATPEDRPHGGRHATWWWNLRGQDHSRQSNSGSKSLRRT